MSLGKKFLLTLAALLIIGGGVLFTVTLAASGWDFTKIGAENYETKTHAITEQFSSISYNGTTAELTVLPSDDGEVRVVCTERKSIYHSVTVEGGVLKITEIDTRKWYDLIDFSFISTSITVYLPSGNYGDFSAKISTGDITVSKDFAFGAVDIEASTADISFAASETASLKILVSTGDVTVSGTTADSLDIETTTGDIKINSVHSAGEVKLTVSTGKCTLDTLTCTDLTSVGNTGDITLKSVIASGKISIERSTGETKFDDADASEISVTASTGDVSGTLLTDKIFITKTSTGDVDVPESTTGGKCKITTSTGDIRIRIAE